MRTTTLQRMECESSLNELLLLVCLLLLLLIDRYAANNEILT